MAAKHSSTRLRPTSAMLQTPKASTTVTAASTVAVSTSAPAPAACTLRAALSWPRMPKVRHLQGQRKGRVPLSLEIVRRELFMEGAAGSETWLGQHKVAWSQQCSTSKLASRLVQACTGRGTAGEQGWPISATGKKFLTALPAENPRAMHHRQVDIGCCTRRPWTEKQVQNRRWRRWRQPLLTAGRGAHLARNTDF